MADRNDSLETRPRAAEILPPRADARALADPRDAATEGYDALSSDREHLDPSLLVRWLRAALKRKWLIALVTVAMTSLVAFDVYGTRNTYQASTLIEIGRENTTVVRDGDVLLQPDDSLKTRALILQSTPLLEDVILSLKLDEDPRLMEVGKKSFREGAVAIAERVLGGDAEDAAPPAEALVTPALQSEEQRRSVAESERLQPMVAFLRKSLTVEEIKDTRLLRLSFRHTDPALAASICNAIAQDFIQRSYEKRIERFSKASEWLDRQTRDLKAQAERAEQALAAYTRDHGMVSTENKETLATEKLTRLHGEALRAEVDRMIKESLYNEVKQGNFARVPEAFADAQTAALRTRLGELELKAQQLDVRYGPENPQVVEVRQQIATVKGQLAASNQALAEKLRLDYERAVRDERSFKGALEEAKAGAVTQNEAAIKYGLLQEELETARASYSDFLRKTNQAGFEVTQQDNNIRVVEPALVPRTVFSPDRRQVIVIGFLVSLAASLALALMLDFLDGSVRSFEDVNRYMQLPALGAIPSIAKSAPLGELAAGEAPGTAAGGLLSIAAGTAGASRALPSGRRARQVTGRGYDKASAAEAYRVLRTSVMLMAQQEPCKSILVCSSMPGEGKTTTTVNTAISLAQLGGRILVMDCDLRSPKVHEMLGIDGSAGLTAYLTGEVSGVDGLIQKLEALNLSVLPAGAVPPNPAELLASDRMRELLAVLADRYDYVLIDSPPQTSLADATILSTLADGVILVVQGGKSQRDSVSRTCRELSSFGARILGVVLNNMPSPVGRSYAAAPYYTKTPR